MTTESHVLTVGGLRVAVVRKAIKNLHLGVYPPDGRVRVAAIGFKGRPEVPLNNEQVYIIL